MSRQHNISRNVWKNRVKFSVLQKAFEKFQSERSHMTKVKNLQYKSLCQQEYTSKLPAYLSTLLMKIRSRSLACRYNHGSSTSQDDKHCRLCHQAVETQEHMVNCYAVNGDDEWLTLDQYQQPQRCVDETRLQGILSRINNFNDMVGELEVLYLVF